MSDLQGGTVKERLARLETIMCNHIAHHENKDKWMVRIVGGLVTGIILMAAPGFLDWLASII